MAEFAELDNENKVLNVFGVNDDVLIGEDGLPDEQLGIAWLNTFIRQSKWKQSFVDGSFRRQPAVKYGLYDEENDVFVDMQPEWNPSFTLVDGKWVNLVLKPDAMLEEDWPSTWGQYTDFQYYWDEPSVSWKMWEFPRQPIQPDMPGA